MRLKTKIILNEKEDINRYEPIPGSWNENLPNEEWFPKEPFYKKLIHGIKKYLIKRKENMPKSNQDHIERYKFFKDKIYNPRRVFYPCCNLDISPIEGFPDSEVILLDNEGATKSLENIMKKAGISNFINADVLDYKPEIPYDLVIILAPQVESKYLTKHLVPGGYAISDNWHNNASQLLEDSKFEGIGTIDRNEKGIYLARGDFSKLEPNQFATYFYVFRKLGEENGL